MIILNGNRTAEIEPNRGVSCWVIRSSHGEQIACVPVKTFHGNRKPADFLNELLVHINDSFQKGHEEGIRKAQENFRKAVGIDS